MTTTPVQDRAVHPVAPGAPAAGAGRPRRAHGGLPWPEARRLATAAAVPLAPQAVALAEAVGRRLVADVRAGTDLPPVALSAMDGWAVAGPGPWRAVTAGRLVVGDCAWVRTGAPVPIGTDRVVPVEASIDVPLAGDARGVDVRSPAAPSGRHIRTPGEEARRGDLLVPAGVLVTPPMVGLAAAGGADTVLAAGRADVRVLVLGDEITTSGPPGPGRTRDALGPQLPAWLAGYGVRPVPPPEHLPDDLDLLVRALRTTDCDVLVTTGGTSVGDRDHVHRAVRRAGGEVVVDGVAVKPGHPMLLARLPAVRTTGGGVRPRRLVALPGNPLAAAVAVVTLLQPLLAALHGERLPTSTVVLAEPLPARTGDRHRLVPVRTDDRRTATTVPACGAAMLRGLAAATGFAVVGPDGALAGDAVEHLELPWAGTGSPCPAPMEAIA